LATDPSDDLHGWGTLSRVLKALVMPLTVSAYYKIFDDHYPVTM